MAVRTTLSDLRNEIQEIYQDVMREQGNWEASNDTVLERVKNERAKELALLTPELVNMALTKLLNEVGNRRGRRGNSSEGTDLFGEYRVPRFVTIIRGKKKDTTKLSWREAMLYVRAHSEKLANDRLEPLRSLLDACRDHVNSDEDTLETLFARMNIANQLAIS